MAGLGRFVPRLPALHLPRSPVVRALGLFWGVALLALGGAAVTLQILGPPKPPAVAQPAPRQEAAPPPAMPGNVAPPAMPGNVAPVHAPAPEPPPKPAEAAAPITTAIPRPGAPIAAPDPALLEPAPSYEGARLPRIGPGQRTPMRVYAAGYDPADPRPRIAILLSDFAMNEQDSDEAIRALPPAVSFAVSPYATRTERLLIAARARGHETLAALPMEPNNHPLNEAGSYALLTGAAPALNALRLEWALSRITGYVGATAALGRLHGERFAAATELHATVLKELARRGLLYIDPRPGAVPPSPTAMPNFRAVDLAVDSPPVRAEVEAKLTRLEQIARERGSALGLASTPVPMTIDRIAAWAVSLPARGFVLVPVSALATPPTKPK